VFSNRGLGWKLAAAILVVVGMGLLSERRGRSIQPSLWSCLAQPARWNGATLWLPKASVTRSDAEGFEIEIQGVRSRVVPAAPLAPGDTVALTGTFEASGPLVRAKEVRKAAAGTGSRRLSEILSIAVLGLILLNFTRHFAFRPKAVQVEGAD